MTIQSGSLDQRLNDMTAAPDPAAVVPSLPATPDQTNISEPQQEVQVAGGPVGLGLDILKGLTGKGARATKPAKLVDEIVQPIPPGATKPAPDPVAPTPTVPAAVKPAPAKPRPVDITEVNKIAAKREEAIQTGTAQAKPPETPISSAWTDNDGLAATIKAAGDEYASQDPSMSLRSIYMQAINAGVPEQFLKTVLAGESLEVTVGGSQLAKQLAGAVMVHDESAMALDNLFAQLKAGALDETGKLNLRLKLAQHKIIVDQLKGIQTDIARSMNVFKRVKDKGPGLDGAAVRAALDELNVGQSDKVLYQLAVDYLDSPTRAGKNRIIEVGLGAKVRDVWLHTFQANLLNDPVTHSYNITSGALFGSLQPIERTIASGIGAIRTKLPNADPDRYYLDDVQAGLSGMKNGILDGWELAKESLKRGGESKMTDLTQPPTPLSSEYLSDTPLKLFGKEVYRTPDLRDTFIGRAIDGISFVQDSMSFRPIAAADEFIGAIAGRYQLHEEAWRFANKEYDRLIKEGMDEATARIEVEAKVTQLLIERPRTMQENIESMRRMVTLQETISKEGVLGETYYGINKFLAAPAVKVFQPFAKTITNLFIEGSSYIPVLNTLSPRFYEMWSKGGRHRDAAMSRLAMGGSAIVATGMLTLDNRMTGSGPSQTEDRKALEALGVQPYSFVFDKGEINEENIERLRAITKVSVGADKIYVSYARFDPISMIFAMGSDMADAAKFDRHPDRSEYEVMAMAGMTATAEYMGNMPVMQFVGEMLSIARSRSNDGGEKIVFAMDAMAKQFANFLYTGTPGVGMSNSTLMAHIERLVDPAKSNIKSPEMNTPMGIRAFYELRQKVMSRIPGLSAGVEPLLDNLGREQFVKNRGLDYWVNWTPVISATEGRRSAADEVFAGLDYGISNPPETWDGVRLSAKQINRFKRLYGQEILMEMSDMEVDTATGEPIIDKETKEPKTKTVMVNLEEAIPIVLKMAEYDALVAGEPLLKGDKQKLIDQTVSQYRQIAKMKMAGDEEGLPDETGVIEFEDLAAAMSRNRYIQKSYGR